METYTQTTHNIPPDSPPLRNRVRELEMQIEDLRIRQTQEVAQSELAAYEKCLHAIAPWQNNGSIQAIQGFIADWRKRNDPPKPCEHLHFAPAMFDLLAPTKRRTNIVQCMDCPAIRRGGWFGDWELPT